MANRAFKRWFEETVGKKSTSAAAGAVTTTDKFMAYMKQLVNKDTALHYDHPNYLTVTADFSTSTWNAVTSHEIATVTGLVRLRVIPEVVANVGNDSNTAKVSLGVEGAKAAFIAATTATQLDTDEIWQSSTGSENLKYITDGSVEDHIINGLDVGIDIATTATTAGSMKFHVWWEPLEASATVVAGAGGAL